MNIRHKITILSETVKKQLNEDLDRKMIEMAVDILNKLKSVDLSEIADLNAAKNAVTTDVTSVVAGDRSIGQKIATFFGSKKNPLIDALAFASSIRNFFPLLTKFVNVLAQDDQGDMTLTEISQDDAKLNASLRKIVAQGLKPQNRKLLESDWAKKFIHNPENIIDDIMNLTPNNLTRISENVMSATQTVNAVANKVENDHQTIATNPEHEKIKEIYGNIKTELGNLNTDQKKAVYKTLDALIKQNKL